MDAERNSFLVPSQLCTRLQKAELPGMMSELISWTKQPTKPRMMPEPISCTTHCRHFQLIRHQLCSGCCWSASPLSPQESAEGGGGELSLTSMTASLLNLISSSLCLVTHLFITWFFAFQCSEASDIFAAWKKNC